MSIPVRTKMVMYCISQTTATDGSNAFFPQCLTLLCTKLIVLCNWLCLYSNLNVFPYCAWFTEINVQKILLLQDIRSALPACKTRMTLQLFGLYSLLYGAYSGRGKSIRLYLMFDHSGQQIVIVNTIWRWQKLGRD
jgi:hypothetical protein